jgi:hypothetical protein
MEKPKTHTVNNGDGIDSLWKIANHYDVDFEKLKLFNPHIINRYKTNNERHGWIYPGDVINIPIYLTSNNQIYDDSNKKANINNSKFLCQQKSNDTVTHSDLASYISGIVPQNRENWIELEYLYVDRRRGCKRDSRRQRLRTSCPTGICP